MTIDVVIVVVIVPYGTPLPLLLYLKGEVTRKVIKSVTT
jgi:hypothetical protein